MTRDDLISGIVALILAIAWGVVLYVVSGS